MKEIREPPAGYEHWLDREKRLEKENQYPGAPTNPDHPLNSGPRSKLGFKKGSPYYRGNS